MEFQALFVVTLMSLCISGAKSTTLTFTNKCPYTIWPLTLARGEKPELKPAGFQLNSTTSFSLDVPDGWSGMVNGRTKCSKDNVSGKLTCESGDEDNPATTFVELSLSANGGQDFYNINIADGFNLPISLTPTPTPQEGGGGGRNCSSVSCSSNINLLCPPELALKGSDGSVVACETACLAFGQPWYCCTGDFDNPQSCKPNQYSDLFRKQCPQAHLFHFDDKSTTFTCAARPNYLITFCP